jgi:hypothetical protein
VRPDALPPLRHLMGAHRSSQPPNPLAPLEVYTYLGVSYSLDPNDVQAAERAFQEHMEDCDHYGMDGGDPPAPYCSCADCYARAIAGFWISYTISALRSGRASLYDVEESAR